MRIAKFTCINMCLQSGDYVLSFRKHMHSAVFGVEPKASETLGIQETSCALDAVLMWDL